MEGRQAGLPADLLGSRERTGRMRELIRDFYKNIASRKPYWMTLLFMTWGAYGFSIMNRTVSIDDLATELYVDGNVWLSEYRWGAVLWKKIFSTGIVTPYIDKFLSIHLMMLAATLCMVCLYSLNGRKKKVWTYAVTASAMVTYPLILEIWEYTCGATIVVPGSFLLTTSVLFYLLTRKKTGVKEIALASLVMAQVVAAAESLACVYVAAVLMILFYKYCVLALPGKKPFAWFFEGLTFAVPLALSLVIRTLVGRAIMAVLGLTRSYRGATKIRWPLSLPEIKALVRTVARLYFVNGVVYFPIAVFDLCVLVFIVLVILWCVRRKSLLPLLLGFFSGVALFILVLIQGEAMPYRTAITFIPFVGFTVYMVLLEAARLSERLSRPLVYRAAVLLLLVCCWRQSVYLNRIFSLNNQRSENEAAVLRILAQDLTANYRDRTVLFIGDYRIPYWIERQYQVDEDSFRGRLYLKLRRAVDPGYTRKNAKYMDTNICSTIDFYRKQFDGELMDEYLSYLGYDLKVCAKLEGPGYSEIWDSCRDRGMNPYEIWDEGEYVVVAIGEL